MSVERSRTSRRFPGFRDYGTIYESTGTITKRYGRSVLATLLRRALLNHLVLHWSGMCFRVPCPRNLWISRSGSSKDPSSRIFISFTRTLKRGYSKIRNFVKFRLRIDIFPMVERRLDKDWISSVFDICRLINFDIELHTVLWEDYSRDRRD